MKISVLRKCIILLVVTAVLTSCSAVKQTNSWFTKGDWYNGMRQRPHESINRRELERQYQKNKDRWDKAFKFLKETNTDNIKPGKYVLDGDSLYVNVTVSPMRDFEKTKWESHRKMIDLQYTCKGKEKMGVADVSKARVTVPYDPKRDVANYEAEGKYYLAGNDTFYLFFPGDAHRPNIKVDDDQNVKKIVIKIRYTE